MSNATKAKPPTPPPDDADLLKLEEVGYQLGRISARSVRRLIEEGKLAACRVTSGTTGGSLRVRRDEVKRFIRASEFTVRPEPEPEARTPEESARARESFKAKIKAEWNTGEDPFAEPARRKGRGAKA